ncbi:zinc metalloprotease HtpX [Streptococcus caprae]|uniref:Protease HtpX homolog n=1 Tax=Streptococcus caprae TaxID=1640501 RepID=A0ABV8CVP9_9STRE
MLYQQIASNKRRTVLLIILFFLLLSAIGYALGYLLAGQGDFGVIIALIIGGIYAIIMIFQSTSVVMSMNHAREVTEAEEPEFYQIVEDMAMVAQVPMPKVYVIDDPALNAFATGSSPDKAAVAATTGILRVMNREEMEAVIGHEISHVRNYDIRISTIAVALASAVTLLSSLGGRMMWYGGGRRRRSDDRDSGVEMLILVFSLIAVMLAPLAASLVQLAISRQREYLADAGSVELTRNPQGMIKALRKLEGQGAMKEPVDSASAALYINEPTKTKRGFQELFYTHPSIADRIARLERM